MPNIYKEMLLAWADIDITHNTDSWELGNDINVSISINGSDTPVTRPETDRAGQSSRDRKRGGGKFKCYWNFEYSWEAWVDY